MVKALKRFAKEADLHHSDVQIVIWHDDHEFNPRYRLHHKYVPVKRKVKDRETDEISFNEILGVKTIDFFNREALISPFIQKTLQRITHETNVAVGSLSVMIMYEDEDIRLLLYQEKQFIRELTLEEDVFQLI